MKAPFSHRPIGLFFPVISCQIWQSAKDPVKQPEAMAGAYFNVYGFVRSRFDVLLPEDDDDGSELAETAQDPKPAETSPKVVPASRLRNQAGRFSCHRTCCRRCR